MNRLAEIGVRGRLLLAFPGISGFAVIAAIAAIVAIYTFSKAGDALQEILARAVAPGGADRGRSTRPIGGIEPGGT